jgi:plastocyanin
MHSASRWTLAAAAALAALPVPALGEGGTINGKVEVQPARFQDETVVYLKDVPGTPAPARHEMDQKGMKFLPLVLAVAAGDTVDFLNHDGVLHNVFSSSHEGFDLGNFKPLEKRSRTFEAPGIYRIACRFHPDMLAWVFVARNRYAVAVDRNGRYVLKDVPPGSYTLAVWNAHLPGAGKAVTVAAGQVVEESISLKR